MYWIHIFPVIFLILRFPQHGLSCPQSCACYVNSEVHCTFRSLIAVPARMPKHVERINLGFNSIQSIAEDSFAGLAKLEMLLIHSNEVHNIPNGAFQDLISLQVFKMSYNKLKVLTSHTFHGLFSLTRLHVDHNKIEFIHPNAFHGLTSLRLLHLEGNLLQQLHANTFCTFNFLDYFRQSTLKHLYLSDNLIQTLPAGMIESMPLLENLYLHGNPWTCDCHLKWLLEWDEQSNGVLKCKKDRSYENGQLCPMCTSPKQLQNQEIQSLKDISCSKPVIYSPDRINSSETYTEDDENDQQLMHMYKDYIGKVILNMTDEHGNKVNLDCGMKKSTDFSKINWNQPQPEEIDINATFSLDFECPMNRENYEKLWKLIAYYSEVPVKLERELMFTDNPKVTYRYRQNPDQDSYYFTGVRSLITAEPDWVIQPTVRLQLNRKLSTAKKVTLSFSTQYSQLIHTKEIQYPKNNWVMIDTNAKTKTSYISIKGKTCQLSCNVKSSETPSIQWSLPDGTILKAPFNSQDSRFSVSAGGHLIINTADAMDSGSYHCIAQVRHEIDILTIRVVVKPPTSQISERSTKVITKTVGETITLTCNALANPDADVNWILPDNVIIDAQANKSNAYLLTNGSLVIPQTKVSDSGLYVCIAANQHGTDHYSVQIDVSNKVAKKSYEVPKIKMRPIIKIPLKAKINIVGDDEGSGEKVVQEETEKYNIVKIGSGKSKGSQLSRLSDKGKKRKDRRKMNVWKGTEIDKGTNIAEGRRKFESRRRINMGNKQIDPSQWANILAKVRGKNVPKTTETPLLTTTEVTAIPIYKTKTPSTISRPPIKSTTESETNVDEISADEEELLMITSSPQPAITHYNHDLTSLSSHIDLDIISDITEDDSKKLFSEGNQDTLTTKSDHEWAVYSTSKPVMSTPETLDINDLAYSIDEEETMNAFTEWEDKDSIDTIPNSPTVEGEHKQDYTTRNVLYGQYLEEESNYINRQTFANMNTAGNVLVKMETTTAEMYTIPMENDAYYSSTHSFKSTSPYEGTTSENMIQSTNYISQIEDNYMHFTTSKLQTAKSMEDYDPIFSKAIGGMIPETIPVTPSLMETTSSINFQLPTTAISLTMTSENIVKDINEDVRSEDYAKQTEILSTNIKKEGIDSFDKENGAENESTTMNINMAYVEDKQTSTSRKMPTVPTHTQRPTTTTSMATNGSIHNPRRRPNGKRRFRPNRFRHRQNNVIPNFSATTQVAIKPLIEQPVVSLSHRENTTKSILPPPLPTTKEMQLYKTTINTPSDRKTTTTSVLTKPIVIHSPEKTNLKSSFVTSAPEYTNQLHTAIIENSEIPVVTPPTTTEPLKTHNTEKIYDLNTLEQVTVATKINQLLLDTYKDKAPEEFFSPLPDEDVFSTTHTALKPLQPYREFSTSAPMQQKTIPMDIPNEAGIYTASITEAPPTIASTIENTLKELNYGSFDLTTKVTNIPTNASVHDAIGTTVQVNIEKYSFNAPDTSYGGKKQEEKLIKPTVYTKSTEYTQSSPRFLVPTTNEHLPSTVKVYETTMRESSTQSAKSVQENIHSLRQNELDRVSASQKKEFAQPRQENFKEIHGTKSSNSIPYFTKQNSQSQTAHKQHHAIPPVQQSPARVTVRTPYIGTHGPLRYFVTNQPLYITNKPEITAYTAQNIQDRRTSTLVFSTSTSTSTTTVPPLFRPRPITPSKFNQGQRLPINYRPFGNNVFTDGKGTMPKIPYQGHPFYMNPRFQYRYNRTKLYRFSGTPKSPLPTLAAPIIMTTKDSLGNSFKRTTVSSTVLRTTTPFTTVRETITSKIPFRYPIFTTPFSYVVQTGLFRPSSTIQSHSYNNPFNQRPPITSREDGSTLRHPNVVQPPIYSSAQGVKPRITTTGFQSLSVPFEMDAVLPCETVGEPKPSISWTKVSTGAVMTANTKIQRFEVLDNGTLHILNLQLQDRGQYLCTAQNLHGSDKMIITLTVMSQQPKILLTRYKDVTVYLGDTVTMDCRASGVPSPHISWIFPDRKIMRAISATESRIMLSENGTLSIKDITFTDRGIYKCVASNVAGADSLTVRVHIAALPPIIQQEKLENISLPQGHSIYIHCLAKGAPLPNIRWILLDGTQVRPSQFANGNMFVFPNGTLYIRNISQKDTGKYECIATNIVGTSRRVIILDVRKFTQNAKITATSPQKTDVTYGSTLRLDCSAAGDPWPRILWRLPSKRLVDSFFSFDSRIKTFANGTLIVYSVTDKDAGDYLCMARNKLGDDYVVLKVNVMMKPAKIQHKKENDHKVTYGGDLKVDCVATGVPNPEISWSLPDGSMVNNVMQSDDSGSRTKRYGVFNNGTLYFNEVGMKEEGDYTCYAVNQIGQDEMRVSVKVVAERAFIKNKTYSIINVPYGDVVMVSCEAKGEPLPQITWLTPANRPIPVLSEKYQIYRDGTLLIQKAQRSDSGNYTCLAHNSGGEEKKIVQIQINVLPPKINGHSNKITTVEETAMKDSRILIDCNAEGIPTPRVMWAFPEGVILPAPYYGNRITVHRNGTLDIKVLRKTDSVHLTCIGRNEGGEARLIVQLTVTEPAEKPKFITDNENIVVAEGETVNLNCSVTGSPEPEISWILPNGTVIKNGNHLHRIFHKTDGTLHIGSVAIADAGTYRCRAQNVAGHADKMVSLQIGRKPQMNNHYNNLISIINGETLQLHCTTQGELKPHISWTLPNGMVIDGPQNKDRFSLLQNGTLVIRDTSVYDRGSYLCKAKTQYGSSTMSVPVIVIAYPPRITTSPAPVIYARPGSSVQLNCMSIGIPKAEITWNLPDKSQLTSLAQSRLYGNKFLHPQGTLVIQHISKRDMGYYKCTAKNILGSDTKTTYIHIY
ncbi:matrix-remodeling-associated protein 5 [Pelobates fuscus]|uniref:matrix-remodeling-associated protein 5 n=1 Tax=Pelobates fuscus TaxID=191477 RepID=UPI002FE4EFB0